MSQKKSIINMVDHAAVISGRAVSYTMLGKSILKMRPRDMGKLNFEDSAKLVGIITASSATINYLVKQGIILADINY